jgi:hypothetical protein
MSALAQSVDLGGGCRAAHAVIGARDPERPGVRSAINAWLRHAGSDYDAVKAWEGGLWQTIDIRPLVPRISCPTLVGELDPVTSFCEQPTSELAQR